MNIEEFIDTGIENLTIKIENVQDVMNDKINTMIKNKKTDLKKFGIELENVVLNENRTNQKLMDYAEKSFTNLSLKIIESLWSNKKSLMSMKEEMQQESMNNLSILENKINLKISNDIQSVEKEIGELKQKVKNCSPGWTKYEYKCYKLFVNKKSWSMSRSHCQSEGGDLVIIKNLEEDTFVFSLSKGKHAWLGGSDHGVEDNFEWVDGSPIAQPQYTNWATNEPNDWGSGEDCLMIRSSDNKWNDAPCARTYAFVCTM